MYWFLFMFYALIATGGALAVVFSQNVVRMAFYLVISLGSTAGLFFLLDADFVGAMQLLIYVGGTVVLLIFGVMLTSSSPFSSIKNTPAEILQGGIVGLAFLTLLISTALSVNWSTAPDVMQAAQANREEGFNPRREGNTARSIGTALLGLRFDRDLRGAVVEDAAHGHAEGEAAHHAAGQAAPTVPVERLSTGYLLPFEIISMHLLVVLIGASYLARAKRSRTASPVKSV